MRINVSFRTAVLTLLLSLPVGCGKDSDQAFDPLASATLGELVSAACAASVRCDATLGVRSCDDLAALCISGPDAQVTAGASCIDALKRATCEEVSYGSAPFVCQVAFRQADIVSGSSDEGGACVDTSDCAFGLTCTSGDASCGTCVTAPVEGEPCTDVGDCGPGLTCGDDDTCQRIPTLGEACDDYLRCTGPAECVDGTCVAPTVRNEGETRGDGERCAGGLVAIDDVCTPLADVGEPCKPGQCYLGSYCDEGECKALAACGTVGEGEPCDGTERCEDGLVCSYDSPSEGGRCTRDSAPLGSACVDAFDCGPGAFCDDGVCSSLDQCEAKPAASRARTRAHMRTSARLGLVTL